MVAMTPDRATLRSLAIKGHFVDKAFLAAYHAHLAGDTALAADRYGAGLAGLRQLLAIAAEGREAAWGEDEQRG